MFFGGRFFLFLVTEHQFEFFLLSRCFHHRCLTLLDFSNFCVEFVWEIASLLKSHYSHLSNLIKFFWIFQNSQRLVFIVWLLLEQSVRTAACPPLEILVSGWMPFQNMCSRTQISYWPNAQVLGWGSQYVMEETGTDGISCASGLTCSSATSRLCFTCPEKLTSLHQHSQQNQALSVLGVCVLQIGIRMRCSFCLIEASILCTN